MVPGRKWKSAGEDFTGQQSGGFFLGRLRSWASE
jgi:hypothetical protein